MCEVGVEVGPLFLLNLPSIPKALICHNEIGQKFIYTKVHWYIWALHNHLRQEDEIEFEWGM
jgi:hypothetical protein